MLILLSGYDKQEINREILMRGQFVEGATFQLNGDFCTIKKKLVKRKFEIYNHKLRGLDIVTVSELRNHWVKKELIFLNDDTTKPDIASDVRRNYLFADFQELPTHTQQTAWIHYCVIYPIAFLPKKERSRSKIQEYAKNFSIEKLPDYLFIGVDPIIKEIIRSSSFSWSAIESWVKKFVDSGYDIRSLVLKNDRKGGKDTKRLNPLSDEEMTKCFNKCAEDKQKHSQRDVWEIFEADLAVTNAGRPDDDKIPKPSKPTFMKRLLERPDLADILGHPLSKIEKKAISGSFSSVSLIVQWILDVVEIDHCLIDLIVVDDIDHLPIGRYTCTMAIDRKSRLPLGYFLGPEPASYLTVMQCLLNAILPFNMQEEFGTIHDLPGYGTPIIVLVDNAPEFIGKDLKDGCAQLGIHLIQCPIEQPWAKAIIERFLKTCETQLFHEQPGSTDSNPQAKGSYDAVKNACVTESTLKKIFALYLTDYYAQNWHTGIEDIPYRVWMQDETAGFIPDLPESIEELKILLSRNDYRVLQRIGIEFESLVYQSEELQNLRGRLPDDDRKIKIKYDPANLGSINVLDEISTPQKWIQVPATNHEYAEGLSLWAHRVIRSLVLAKKELVDEDSLAATKARIRELVLNDYYAAKNNKGRKALARLMNGLFTDAEKKKMTDAADKAKTNKGKKREPKNSSPADTSENKVLIGLRSDVDSQYAVDYDLPV
jgi:putative transposase